MVVIAQTASSSFGWLDLFLENLCIIEFLVLIILSLVCVGTFGFLKTASRRHQKLQEKAHTLLLNLFETGEQIHWSSFPKSLKRLSVLLPLLESLDRKVNSSSWNAHKRQIVKELLLPQARRFAFHKEWTYRALAAKCFVLAPLSEDESFIIKLLSDDTPLVYSSAALSAVVLETPKCINAILDKMVLSSRFARSTLRDALLKGTTAVYALLEARYLKEDNPEVRLCCLQVLSAKVFSLSLFEPLKADINSPFLQLRLEAIRTLAHRPMQETFDLLIPLLDDSHYEIQALAARTLGRLNVQEAVLKLSQKLQDPQLWVRLNAALALKDLGNTGIKILRMQDADLNELAYSMADFVLTLPSSNTFRLERWYA